MRAFEITIEIPSGSVLVGGYSAATDGLDAMHARGRDGRPIIPSTSLRGALRETYEALLRGAGGASAVCESSGTTVDPSKAICACEACRMFGTGRPDISLGMISPLILEDARLAKDVRVSWSVRDGVAIARAQRRAADERVYDRMVPAPDPGLKFVARGRFGVSELEKRFESLVQATTHLGSSRSRGYGHVRMRLAWHSSGAASNKTSVPEGDLALFVKLTAPTSIGVALPRSNTRGTRKEAPGSTVRGMIGWALAASGLHDIDALVGEVEGATFDFLHPVEENTDRYSATPMPLTARECKTNGRAHGLRDTLFARIASKAIEHLGASALARDPPLFSEGSALCSICRAPMKGSKGTRGGSSNLHYRVITRLSMDRERSAAKSGMLFSHEMLDASEEAPLTFSGSIRGVSKAGADLLARALAAPLSLGRGHAHGWGRATARVEKLAPASGISARRETFVEALRGALAKQKLDPQLAPKLVPLTLLSPLVIGADAAAGEDGGGILRSFLGDIFESWFLRIRRFDVEVGWIQREGGGRRKALQSVVAGSIFVAKLKEEPDRAWLRSLETLESSGAGERTKEGYGRVLCFDPFFTAGAQT